MPVRLPRALHQRRLRGLLALRHRTRRAHRWRSTGSSRARAATTRRCLPRRCPKPPRAPSVRSPMRRSSAATLRAPARSRASRSRTARRGTATSGCAVRAFARPTPCLPAWPATSRRRGRAGDEGSPIARPSVVRVLAGRWCSTRRATSPSTFIALRIPIGARTDRLGRLDGSNRRRDRRWGGGWRVRDSVTKRRSAAAV